MKKIIIFLGVFLAVIAIYVIVIHNIPGIIAHFDVGIKVEEVEKRGQFGDSTAIVNTLFSALAFSGVIVTLIFQMLDNKQQQRLSNISRFEQNFFTMTGNLENIVANLTYTERVLNPFSIPAPITDNGGVPTQNVEIPSIDATSTGTVVIKGREIFEYIYNRQMIGSNVVGVRNALKEGGLDSFEQAMSHGLLDHYFRYLYRIIKYVDDSELFSKDDKRKQYYVSIVRSQISCYELLLIFYNCQLSNHKKFKDLIEKYTFFNNLRAHLLATEAEANLYEAKLGDQHQVDNEVMPVTEYAKSAFMPEREFKEHEAPRARQQSYLKKLQKGVKGLATNEDRIQNIESTITVIRNKVGV